ncbi:hypothetical protein EJB05_30341, partial [Eragrostis curvula]
MQSKKRAVEKKRVQEKWQRPRRELGALNVDGVFDVLTERAGLGVIIRNAAGGILLTSEETEALAAREGILLAAEWCKEKALLETECLTVVALLKRLDQKSTLHFIIKEVVDATRSLPGFDVKHVRT